MKLFFIYLVIFNDFFFIYFAGTLYFKVLISLSLTELNIVNNNIELYIQIIVTDVYVVV